MKFKSAAFTQTSGSVGGMTFGHNKGGLFVRARSIPTDPSTALQTTVRNSMTQLSAAWIDQLTPTQRDGWETYAENVPIIDRLGDPITVSGLNMYVRGNVARLQTLLPRVDTAPTIFNLGSFTDPAFVIDTANDEVDVTFTDSDDWANEDDSAMLIFGSQPQNPTINFFKGPYRFLARIDGDGTTPPTSPAAIALSVPIVAGQRMFFLARVSRADGRYSGKFRGTDLAA